MCEDTMLTSTTGDRLLEKLWSCISNVKVYAANAVISRGHVLFSCTETTLNVHYLRFHCFQRSYIRGELGASLK